MHARLALCCVVLGLQGCQPSQDDIAQAMQQRLARASDVVRDDLEGHIESATQALDALEAALLAAGDEAAPRFQALEDLRDRFGLSGLSWEGPGGSSAWAGRPVDPPPLPPVVPWERSFRAGQLSWHEGPHLRAIVVGPRAVLGGHASASLVIEAEPVGAGQGRPFAERWLNRLELEAVRVLPPDAKPPNAKEGEPQREALALVRPFDREVALAVRLRVHDAAAVAEQLAGDAAERSAVFHLLAWATAVLALAHFGLRRVRSRMMRYALAALLALVARQGLRHIALADALPPLEEATLPTQFAIDSPLGWLASPADFALSALAYLLAVVFLGRLVRMVGNKGSTPKRTLYAVVAACGAGAIVGIWHALVQAAVRGGRDWLFRVHDMFLPNLHNALMVVGVVLLAAASFLGAASLLRASRRLAGRGEGGWMRLAGAAVAMLVAWPFAAAAGFPHLAVPAMLLAAAYAPMNERLFGVALPSQALLTSVVATALAFPLLWAQVAGRDRESLGRHLHALFAAEESILESVALALRDARDSPHVRNVLLAARKAPPREGLAYHLWLTSDFQGSRHPCVVSVLDGRGRLIESFSLSALPPTLLLDPQPPSSDERDDEIWVDRGDAERLRAVVGRTRLRDEQGPLGTIVFTVPDLVELHLRGLGDSLHPSLFETAGPISTATRPETVEIRGHQIVRASDPTVSRLVERFGPARLATLSSEWVEGSATRPYFAWDREPWQGFAAYSPERGATHAVRRMVPGTEEALLALSRVVLLGVGLGSLVAIAALLVGLRRFRPQLHHRILVSYFLISVIPLVLLGLASARDARLRFDNRIDQRLSSDLARMRGQLERLGGALFDLTDSRDLQRWGPQAGHDTVLYSAEGSVVATNRPGLVVTHLLPPRLPAEVYRATVLEQRRIVLPDSTYAGRPAWFGYEPILDAQGRTRATVGVPLYFDRDRFEQEVTTGGSVLLAAYLLTLVLVLVGAIFAADRIARPLELLAVGTRKVAAGDLEVELPGEGSDEFGQLVANFNQMTRELREATAKAIRAERESAWRKMARQVAHEIKNPLTPMRLMIQQMEAESIDPARAQEAIRRAAPVVLRQIETLTRIAGDFANFARLPKRRNVEIDPAALVEEVVALHAGTAARGIVVSASVERGLPNLYWDEEELRRALINLVRNGMQAISGSGEVVLAAKAEAREGRQGVAISVADTGSGISPEHMERLFEPHFSTKTSGMGLGLAIVRRIVTDSGGTIHVSSRVGRGTTFTLWWHTAWEGR